MAVFLKSVVGPSVRAGAARSVVAKILEDEWCRSRRTQRERLLEFTIAARMPLTLWVSTSHRLRDVERGRCPLGRDAADSLECFIHCEALRLTAGIFDDHSARCRRRVFGTGHRPSARASRHRRAQPITCLRDVATRSFLNPSIEYYYWSYCFCYAYDSDYSFTRPDPPAAIHT